MALSYNLEPREIPEVNTPFRRMKSPFPPPGSLGILSDLRRYEPASLSGQPPAVWDRAEGVQVMDAWGNRWLDFSSGVLVTNAGHARVEIARAIKEQVDQGLLHNYCFPSAHRARLAKRLVEMSPAKLDKCFILTTGSETTENALKLMRSNGRRVGGDRKIGVISFERAFHGRTLGAQQMGGTPALKEWIVNLDPDIHQLPFPDGFRTKDTSFAFFEKTLAARGLGPDRIAGVIMESYQGGGASFAPVEYVQALAAWCAEHQVVLTMDEVQACCGRTGKMFAFEHYGIVPDLLCLGKGITSSLPLAAVLGRADLMDQFAPGTMTSTHTGNPICIQAALASLDLIEREDLPGNAAKMGRLLLDGLAALQKRHPAVIAAVHGKGLVAGMHLVKPGSEEPDGELAFRINERCLEKGLLMFAPVGLGGATIKLSPPLTIKADAVREGLQVLDEAFAECLK